MRNSYKILFSVFVSSLGLPSAAQAAWHTFTLPELVQYVSAVDSYAEQCSFRILMAWNPGFSASLVGRNIIINVSNVHHSADGFVLTTDTLPNSHGTNMFYWDPNLGNFIGSYYSRVGLQISVAAPGSTLANPGAATVYVFKYAAGGGSNPDTQPESRTTAGPLLANQLKVQANCD